MHQNGTYRLLASEMPSPSAFLPLKIGFTGAASLAPQEHTSPPLQPGQCRGVQGAEPRVWLGVCCWGEPPPAASTIKVRQSPGARGPASPGASSEQGAGLEQQKLLSKLLCCFPQRGKPPGGAKSSLPPASRLQESPLAFPALLDNGRLNYSLPSAAVWPGLCQALARGLPPPPLPQGLGGSQQIPLLGGSSGAGSLYVRIAGRRGSWQTAGLLLRRVNPIFLGATE